MSLEKVLIIGVALLVLGGIFTLGTDFMNVTSEQATAAADAKSESESAAENLKGKFK